MAQLQPQNDDHNYDTIQIEKSDEAPKIEVIDSSQEDATDSHSINFDVNSNVSTTRQENTQSTDIRRSRRATLQLRILM